MLAPIMTAILLSKLISCDCTNDIRIEVVALLLCIMAVTKVPIKTPVNGFIVAFSSMSLSELPATLCKLVLNISRPNRNTDKPPSTEKTLCTENCSNCPVIQRQILAFLYIKLLESFTTVVIRYIL